MNTVTRFALAMLILVNSALADDIVLAPRGAATGDISGAQMRAAAGILMDATDIKNVVAYINSLASH